MDPLEKQKLERQAVNGKMCMMFGGIFLIFSAITSTLVYGMGYFLPALEANRGNQEYIDLLETNGLQSSFLMVIGILYMLMAVWEVATGFNCAKNSNRVDRSRFMQKLVVILLVVEVIFQGTAFFLGLSPISLVFSSIVLPLFLLWGVTRLRKVAKAQPDRVYAVDNSKNKAKRQAQAQAQAAPKKSIRERAAMQARLEEDSAEAATKAAEQLEAPEATEAAEQPEPPETAEAEKEASENTVED